MTDATKILVMKLLVLATWLFGLAAPLFGGMLGTVGLFLIALLASVHLIECFVFYGTLKKTGRPLPMELVQTFLFGVAHFAEARALAEASAGDPPDPAH